MLRELLGRFRKTTVPTNEDDIGIAAHVMMGADGVIEAGRQAKDTMEFKLLWDLMRVRLSDEFFSTTPEEDDHRESIYFKYLALNTLFDEMRGLVYAGQSEETRRDLIDRGELPPDGVDNH